MSLENFTFGVQTSKKYHQEIPHPKSKNQTKSKKHLQKNPQFKKTQILNKTILVCRNTQQIKHYLIKQDVHKLVLLQQKISSQIYKEMRIRINRIQAIYFLMKDRIQI